MRCEPAGTHERGTQTVRNPHPYAPAMASELRWGRPPWVWRALAVSTLPGVLLLLFSLTVSARVFGVMLLVAEAFTALVLFLGWAREERARFEAELDGSAERLPPV